MKKPGKYRYVYRSAIRGRFVSAAYAKAHPRTTVRQRILRVPTRCQ